MLVALFFFTRSFFLIAKLLGVVYNCTMTIEEFCYSIYKHTFALVLFNGVYAAHVTVRMKRNPFNPDELENAFRKFIWDTPLSNLDLSIVEDPSVDAGVLLLDSVEPFGDGETNPDMIPFHVDVQKVFYENGDS